MSIDIAPLLQQAEDRRRLPGGSIDLCGKMLGQGARDIFVEAAARDVHHAMNVELFDERQTHARIEPRRCQKLLAKRLLKLREGFSSREALVLEANLAHEREAVRVNARGRQREQHVALLDALARDDLRLLDDADGKARDVVLAISIEARHLRRLAADERTSRLLAGGGNALDDSGHLLGDELADGEVVEKEKRLCTLHENVVDAHGDGVLSHGIVLVEHEGKPQLRAHAVRARNEHRLLVLRCLQRKEAAEAAEVAEHFGAVRRTHAVLDELDGFIARVDIDARIAIGKFLFHSASSNTIENEKM